MALFNMPMTSSSSSSSSSFWRRWRMALVLLFLLNMTSISRGQRERSRARTAEEMPLCQNKESERIWSDFMNANYQTVFPTYNRNFGGAKWFRFCEDNFCPDEARCDKDRMLCCTHSYCPYSGAAGGGAARRYNQVLLDYCITADYTVSICCSPCTCQLSPTMNQDMSVQEYKGMPTLFEHSCESCAAAKSRMQPCTCQNPDEVRPVAILGRCDSESRPGSHGRMLNSEHYKTCRSDSWDPMRGRPGIGGWKLIFKTPFSDFYKDYLLSFYSRADGGLIQFLDNVIFVYICNNWVVKRANCFAYSLYFHLRLRSFHPSVLRSVRPSVHPSLRPSVFPSVPCYFRMTKIVDFVDGKS